MYIYILDVRKRLHIPQTIYSLICIILDVCCVARGDGASSLCEPGCHHLLAIPLPCHRHLTWEGESPSGRKAHLSRDDGTNNQGMPREIARNAQEGSGRAPDSTFLLTHITTQRAIFKMLAGGLFQHFECEKTVVPGRQIQAPSPC